MIIGAARRSSDIGRCFAATGGAWLLDEQQAVAGGKINLVGMTCRSLCNILAAA